jgi:hypothetical protein
MDEELCAGAGTHRVHGNRGYGTGWPGQKWCNSMVIRADRARSFDRRRSAVGPLAPAQTGSRPLVAESAEQELAVEQVLHIGATSAQGVLFFASMSGLVLTPVAVLAGALGLWRFGADMGWTSHFFIADGLFSRYQFWLAAAIGAHASALIVNRWVANRSADLTGSSHSARRNLAGHVH